MDDDKRMVCKYGTKCYQKNPAHHQKYKHPPKRNFNKVHNEQPAKKPKIDHDDKDTKAAPVESPKVSNDISDSDDEAMSELKIDSPESKSDDVAVETNGVERKTIPDRIDHAEFIREKFLVGMPDDFYKFWDVCREMKASSPSRAFAEIGLELVGPYDVLADKFCGTTEKSPEEYLIHWRYYYDPPEFQTVLKADGTKGYHVGYYRDAPKEDPAFVGCNYAEMDGVIETLGSNIFTAVNQYMETVKQSGDPFRKLKIPQFQKIIRAKAEEYKYDLSKKTAEIAARSKKVVARTFNKAGIVVPVNKKTQVGYRELTMGDRELRALLAKLRDAAPEQLDKFLTELQPILTNTNIAIDECDFGTGLELGLDVLYFGIDAVNRTVSRLLSNTYRLLGRDEFAEIVVAHMKNRRRGCRLSILN